MVDWIGAKDIRVYASDPVVRNLAAALASTDMAGGEWMRLAFITGFEQALHNTSLTADQFYDEWAHAGFPAVPPVEGLTSGERGIRSPSFIAAREWLRKRWHQEWPNEAHCQQLADYADALSAAPKATATASVREWDEGAAYCNKCGFYCIPEKHGFHLRPGNRQPCDYAAPVPDSGAAATIGGERA